jgi:hypothetical protein
MNMVVEILGYGFIVTTVLGICAKLVPNHKLYNWGMMLGSYITMYGSSHMPKSLYEKLEKYVQDSFGTFFGGVTDGLNIDDPKYKPKFTPKKDVKR